MKILARINARKIVFSFFYQHCFFCKLGKSDIVLKDVLSIDDIYVKNENYQEEKNKLIEQIAKKNVELSEDQIEYFIKYFFDRWAEEDIEIDYIIKMFKGLIKYKNKIKDVVNKYTTSFGYDDMDIIDQALFMLGYIEWKVLGTPKEVLLNELVELAKRYSDQGSSKLINGIMHNVITNNG